MMETATSLGEKMVREMRSTQDFFDRSTNIFTEADSQAAPASGGMTIAQQVAHTAQTINWFLDGAFTDKGYRMDFDAMNEENNRVTSLNAARADLARAFDRAAETFSAASDELLHSPVPNAPIMPGAPRVAVASAIVDHTAHHRGALTVYARLIGKVAPMPYM